MKKFLLGLSLVLLGGSLFATEVKFENLTWFNYGGTFNTNFTLQTNASTWNGGFNISRNYVQAKFYVNDHVKGRITFDLSKAVNVTASGTPYSEYFKYAFVDIKVASPLTFTLGLQKSRFGYTGKWEYNLPYAELADSLHVAPSADLGLGVSGKVAGGMLAYGLQVLNGEGYKHWMSGDMDVNYAVQADAVLKPVKNIAIGLSFHRARNGVKFDDPAFALYVDSKFDKFSALLNIVGKNQVVNTTNTNFVNVEAVFGYEFNKASSAFLSFKLAKTLPYINLAMNYKPGGKTVIKPYLGVKLDSKNENEYTFGVQTEIKFNVTVGSKDIKKEIKVKTASTNG